MFNQNSTSSERRAFLMALLDTENDDEEVLTLFVYLRKAKWLIQPISVA